ncbi:synaptopodin-2 isoform X1 [Antennarius striatus]|uniref:synaptopodin-2 isoform X1 n=1 Tax=Antennarius striatus TaxID=241820 RepID=UPI0035AE1E09
MEPQAENMDSNHGSVPWSGSEGSQEICVSESFSDSFCEDNTSDAGSPVDPQSAFILESPQQISGRKEEVSYQEEDEICHSKSGQFTAESAQIQTSPTSLSPHLQHCDIEAGQISQPNSALSSSSPSCVADMTLALTLATEQPLGPSKRQGKGTGNRRVESSEEGGSAEAPPALVFFGISDKLAEQAEKWNSESDTDLCRPERQRARYTRISHKSQAERQVTENKSKCKRIAQLLTNAPNPQNKGALLFNKRRQRVKKYTLVSYGTGDDKLDSEEQIVEEVEEFRTTGYSQSATSESDLEEECAVHHYQHNLRLNWRSVQEMETETKGKGVLMFALRRKRMDELTLEQEELNSKGTPFTKPERTDTQNVYETKEMYEQAKYIDANVKQHVEYQDNIQQMNQQPYVPKPLVPNRTAKPFLGFQDGTTAPIMPCSTPPLTKKHEPRFKVPVPSNTNPLVWSPTGDIIASRDERISVPAIKTGILPEAKRKINKQPTMPAKDLHPQNKGERKSYIESEEDCFSLGAEACNFMQPRTVKLKNPPPVAPKPTINPACPPWLRRSPSSEIVIVPKSPGSQPPHSPVDPHSQHYLQQLDFAQPQQIANHWNQTQATPANAWAPVKTSSQLPLQPSTNSWGQQPPRSAVSMHTHNPTYSPHHPPSPVRSKTDSAPHSVASCPPKAGKAYIHTAKASHDSTKGQVSDRANRRDEGPTIVGKGAALFAKRQSRMEKFVVDAEKVQDKKTRSPSPTLSLPNYWRYSSNIRAPPPLSYNPLLAPFHPQSATKQPPSTNPAIKPKTKQKPKAKHLNTLDIMKHQPYHLDSSLFKYDAVPEVKSPSPKPMPASKLEAAKCRKHKSASSQYTHKGTERELNGKVEVPVKSPPLVSSQNSSASKNKNTKSAELLATDKNLEEKHAVTPVARHITNKQSPSSQSLNTSSQQPSVVANIASAFSPASLIARGARQMAPRPKFSAKKTVVTGSHWRPVAMIN